LGENLCAQDRCAEAVPLYRRSLQIREDRLGKKHIQIVFSLDGLASAHRCLGEPKRAIPLLERALELLEGVPGREVDVAELRFDLARDMWHARRSRAQAKRYAEQALESLAATDAERAAEVRAWLAQLDGGATP
jgi:hypothetical protein